MGTSDQISNISFTSPVYFDLIDTDNNTEVTTEVIECSGHILGTINIPSSNASFSYRLRGNDTSGRSFSLILPMAPVTFKEPSIEVTILTPTPVTIAKGVYSIVRYSFRNTNKGLSPLIVNLWSDIAYPVADIQYPDGQLVSLGPLETKEISITIRPDSSVADNTTFNITLSIKESCMNKTKAVSSLGIIKCKLIECIIDNDYLCFSN